MSLEWELYEEKRRKLRRSSFFRGIFFTLALLVVGVVIFLWRSEEIYSPHIAVYDLEGVIFDDFEKEKPTNTAEALAAKFRNTDSSEMVL